MQTSTMIGDEVVSALAEIGMSRCQVTQREARLDTLLSLLLQMDDDQPIIANVPTVQADPGLDTE